MEMLRLTYPDQFPYAVGPDARCPIHICRPRLPPGSGAEVADCAATARRSFGVPGIRDLRVRESLYPSLHRAPLSAMRRLAG